MGRWNRRKDGCHNEIEKALRGVGWQVTDISFCGRGVPDILAASGCLPSITVLVEAKMPGEKLSPAEVRFHSQYVGNLVIADSGTCAVIQLSEIRARHLGIRYV